MTKDSGSVSIAVGSKEALHEHRRSRSLSSLDSPISEHAPSLPDIKVECAVSKDDNESEFDRFHREYSPSDMTQDAPRISHSLSENSLDAPQRPPPNTMSKMEGFFRKTKTALGTVGPKLRELSLNKEVQSIVEDPQQQQQQQQKQQQQPRPQSDSVKTTLKRMNVKFATRAAEMKSKVLPEFKNRIQNALASSPKAQRKKLLTEDEKERRLQCKTKILELWSSGLSFSYQ